MNMDCFPYKQYFYQTAIRRLKKIPYALSGYLHSTVSDQGTRFIAKKYSNRPRSWNSLVLTMCSTLLRQLA